MNFENILNDIEELLIGKELQSINPSTPAIFINSMDRVRDKYYISSSENKKIARPISELRMIFDDLLRKGFASVDQSLYGGGSSRNQPETILANLPYIQFFKYKNRKHIILRQKNVHEAGTISELQGSDFRRVRKQVENFLDLDFPDVVKQQNKFIAEMHQAYYLVLKKYPGESTVQKIDFLLNGLSNLNNTLAESIVSLDAENEEHEKSEIAIIDKSFSSIRERVASDPSNEMSIEASMDSSEVTGVDDGDSDLADDDVLPSSSFASSNVNTGNVTRIRQLTPVLSLIFDRVQFEDIELQPDFQRKDRIWKADKKAKLIESILMRLPLPVFYFAERIDGSWIVVDGLQRITTIFDFMSGHFPLDKLEVLDNLNGKYFKDLSRIEQRDIREYAITAYLIDIESDSSNMIVELFHRINTYGVKLSEQEIRSALNQGSSVKFLRYLASLNEFKVATQNKVKSDRQKDMELCLSALAFIMLGYESYGQNSYDSFVSKAMSELNRYTLSLDNQEEIDQGVANINSESKEYKTISNRFRNALLLSNKVFGEFAFVKDQNTNRSPISKQLFELIISHFYFLNEIEADKIIEKSSELVDMLYTAIENNSPEFATWGSKTYIDANRGFRDALSTSTGKKISVIYRFESFSEILKRSTGITVNIKPEISRFQ